MQVERWLRKEFYNMENSRETLVEKYIILNSLLQYKYNIILFITYRVTLKDIKAFFPRVHCKISTSKLRELFQEVDTRKRNELNFDEFVILYYKLINSTKVSYIIFIIPYNICFFILLDFQRLFCNALFIWSTQC